MQTKLLGEEIRRHLHVLFAMLIMSSSIVSRFCDAVIVLPWLLSAVVAHIDVVRWWWNPKGFFASP